MKLRIKQNVYGNWNGYRGAKRVEDFGLDDVRAEAWVTGRNEVDLMRERHWPHVPMTTEREVEIENPMTARELRYNRNLHRRQRREQKGAK